MYIIFGQPGIKESIHHFGEICMNTLNPTPSKNSGNNIIVSHIIKSFNSCNNISRINIPIRKSYYNNLCKSPKIKGWHFS